MSLSILTGALIFGLWMGLGPIALVKSVLSSTFDIQTISLFLVVALIMIMSRIMEESGHMTRLVKSFARLSNDRRVVGMVMSALIGLLPMPGGALFSAPMVEASLAGSKVTSEQKTALNYWFRHIWEYWWPLYPGVILAVALLEVETWQFVSVMLPIAIISLTSGIIFIFRPLGKEEVQNQEKLSWNAIKSFLMEMMPIIIVILMMVILTGLGSLFELMGFAFKLPSILLIPPGLLASIIYVCLVNNTHLSQLGSSIFRKDNAIMLFLIFAIMIFKGIMEDSDAVIHIRNELMTYGIPVMLLVLIMPFLSGFILGIAIGFVGASFPLIIPLIQSPDMLKYLTYAALAYTFGYIGMMTSPVHLCLLVTKDYFKANLISTYSYIIKTGLTVLITVSVLFLLMNLS